MNKIPAFLYSAEFRSEEHAQQWRERQILELRDAHIAIAKWHTYRKMTNQVGIPEYLTDVIESALYELTRGVYVYAPSQSEIDEIKLRLADART